MGISGKKFIVLIVTGHYDSAGIDNGSKPGWANNWFGDGNWCKWQLF